MNTVEVEHLEEKDRPALVQMLEASNDFPQQLLMYYRRRGSRYEEFVAWHADEIVGVVTGSFVSDFHQSGAFDSFDLPQHRTLSSTESTSTNPREAKAWAAR